MSSQEAILGHLRPATKRLKYQHPKAPRNFKRNVLPPLAGIAVMAGVLGAINGQWLLAQLQYQLHQHQAAVSVQADRQAVSGGGHTAAVAPVDDTRSPDPAAGPQVEIPAIGVKAPVINEPGMAEWQIQLALRKGVVRYATSAEPGQNGNTVIFGHSSGQPWAPGDYKFVFTLLDKLKAGDEIKLDYQGTRYTYLVTGSEVVLPTAVSVLAPTSEPSLTLITCTPVGSSAKRLVVHAKLIRPLPVSGSQANGADVSVKPVASSTVPTGQAEAASEAGAVAAPATVLPSSAGSSPWQSFTGWLRGLF